MNPEPAEQVGVARNVVAVVSGKGGVGKTNLVANLAVAAGRMGGRTLLVDGDFGLANVDVLLGLTTRRTVENVLSGECAFEDALTPARRGVFLLPAAAGCAEFAALPPKALLHLTAEVRRLAASYDLVLADAGAGVGSSVVGLAAASDRALLVTTPEPTSLADAYATLKVLVRRPAAPPPIELLVNGARDELQAREVHARLERLAHRFLDARLGYRGFVPRDPRLEQAVAQQKAVVELHPTSPSSRRLVALARELLREVRGGGTPITRSRPAASDDREVPESTDRAAGPRRTS